jgi:hypothetical protein
MDPVALLIHAAYEGACAVCEPLIRNPDGMEVQIDPLIQDVGLKQKGLLVYEEAKVQGKEVDHLGHLGQEIHGTREPSPYLRLLKGGPPKMAKPVAILGVLRKYWLSCAWFETRITPPVVN